MSNVPRINRVRNAIQYDGAVMTPDTTEVTTVLADSRGVLFAYGATVPTDAEAGYAKGCIFIDTDAAAGSVVYINEGSATSCDFNTASLPTGDISGVTAGGGLTGGGTSGTVTLAISPAGVVQAVTATNDGTTTGTIANTTTHATVTSSASNKQVVLPAPTPGYQLVIDVGANGFDLKSSAPATVAINGGTGASAKSAIAANSTVIAICISATAWKAFYLDADSDVAKVAAAA